MANDYQAVVRVPSDVRTRAERLVPVLAGLDEYQGMRISTMAVYRLALLRGLLAIEREQSSKAKRTRKARG